MAWQTWYAIRQEKLNRRLIAAIGRNDLASVTSLLEQGTDANACAVSVASHPFWRMLLDRISVSRATNASSQSALLIALNVPSEYESMLPSYEDTSGIVKALLDKGATTSITNEYGQPPVMIAAKHDLWPVVDLLLYK